MLTVVGCDIILRRADEPRSAGCAGFATPDEKKIQWLNCAPDSALLVERAICQREASASHGMETTWNLSMKEETMAWRKL
jgi:hypothetical protein